MAAAPRRRPAGRGAAGPVVGCLLAVLLVAGLVPHTGTDHAQQLASAAPGGEVDLGPARAVWLPPQPWTTWSPPGPELPDGSEPPAARDPAPDAADPGLAASSAEAFDPGPPREVAPAVRTSEGFEVAAGTATAGAGPVVTYTVEVEPATGADLLAVTAAVEEALGDPRSWARDRTLERVEDPAAARIRVLLATPDTVDQLCGQVGLRTLGRFSCFNGRFAALNAMRWEEGAAGFADLTTYRRYLVNHEFGHGLGYGHVECPGPGQLAPVMMQQSMGVGSCEANGWPHPNEPVG